MSRCCLLLIIAIVYTVTCKSALAGGLAIASSQLLEHLERRDGGTALSDVGLPSMAHHRPFALSQFKHIHRSRASTAPNLAALIRNIKAVISDVADALATEGTQRHDAKDIADANALVSFDQLTDVAFLSLKDGSSRSTSFQMEGSVGRGVHVSIAFAPNAALEGALDYAVSVSVVDAALAPRMVTLETRKGNLFGKEKHHEIVYVPDAMTGGLWKAMSSTLMGPDSALIEADAS